MNWFFALMLLIAADDARADQIMNRLFPKTKKLELGLSGGFLLNPAFVDTQLAEASGRYFFSESWGIGLSHAIAQNKDRGERECVESFYNDPQYEVEAVCGSEDESGEIDGAEEANVGPAYMPIRQLESLTTAYGDYSLAYGKMIFLHGATGHFDLRVRFGSGITRSTYYEQQPNERQPGVVAADSSRYGEAGRPAPERQATPHLYLGLAEDLLFLKRFTFGGEVASYLLMGTPRGTEPFLVIRIGVGIRL